jgi:hypothetical protein
MVKEDSLIGQAIEAWCLYHRIAIGAGMGPSPVIGNGKQDIGFLDWFFITSACKQEYHSQAKKPCSSELLDYFHGLKIVNLSIISFSIPVSYQLGFPYR